MQIFRNVLSVDLLAGIKAELASLINQNVWKSSLLSWPKDILKNVIGDCSIAFVSQEKSLRLAEALKEHLPHAERLVFQYYVWKQNAAISLHKDSAYKFGATIYLNENWDIDCGGLFLWQHGSELKGFCPEYNSMVLNNSGEAHLVTPVNPLSPVHRYTIQVWGV